MTDALRRLVEQLDNDRSLFEPNQFRRRLEALDQLDVYSPRINAQAAFAADSIEPELCRRARAICARLEAANCELYESIRGEIQRGPQPDTLLRWIHPLPHMEDDEACANGMGYDYLDELISGVFQFEEPAVGQISRDSEKVFYQPTPARHIFTLLKMTALTAADVLVDLGSGLGHVSLLASICTHASSVGIESESAYIGCARQCAQRLNLHDKVTFIHQDARLADFSAGTVFYLYSPFTGSILNAVLHRLKHEAAARPIRICSYGPCASVIAKEPWLKSATTPGPNRIALFHPRD
ncbi:MAG: class I SAM-dependent methyltransferase [Candidatus Acidiferrum sp.]